MAATLEEAVEQLRKRLDSGATRLAIEAPPGFGKSAVLARLAASFAGSRRVVHVELPEERDAGLVALVHAATELSFAAPNLVHQVVPPKNPARTPWASRLAAVREALARAGDDVVVLVDEPMFEPALSPGDELFARRAMDISETLLRTRGPVVLAGTSIPHGVAERVPISLPLASSAGDVAWATVARGMEAPRRRPLPPVVAQVREALRLAGVDVDRIPAHDLRLDRLVAHDLARVFLEHAAARRTFARLAVLRAPFSKDALDHAGFSALSELDRAVIDRLLSTLEGGMRVVPRALAHAVGARMAMGDPAWTPDEGAGEAHRFAALHHRARFDAARAAGDVGTAAREELEEIHHLTEAGDAAALLGRSLQFVEQYDALGRSLSQRALHAPRDEEEKLRLDAVRAYERAIEHDARDAYAHHYIAYNLDILALERERVNSEYTIAKDIERAHAWYHSRHVCFLITLGRLDEARAAWERALVDLEEAGVVLASSGYRALHAEVANHLLSRAQLRFASEVLEDVPEELRREPWWRALTRLRVCLEEDRDERLLFPPSVPLEERWERPHLTRDDGELSELTRWRPGRVLGRDDDLVMLVVGEDPREQGEKLTTLHLEAKKIEEEWNVPQRMLAAGTFVELLEYEDGGREMRLWDPPSSSFAAIPNLPALFPRPDRYVRRGFTSSRR